MLGASEMPRACGTKQLNILFIARADDGSGLVISVEMLSEVCCFTSMTKKSVLIIWSDSKSCLCILLYILHDLKQISDHFGHTNTIIFHRYSVCQSFKKT